MSPASRIRLLLISALSLLFYASCASRKLAKKEQTANCLPCDDWAKDGFPAPTRAGNQYSARNAYSLAKACRLVWEKDKSAIASVAKSWGLQHLFVDLRSTHTQYLLLGNEQFTILAFRATEASPKDIGTVLKTPNYVTLKKDGVYADIPPAAGGFRTAVADAFLAGLTDDLEFFRKATRAQSAPLFITGHSLGGALALLARAKLKARGTEADSLYVFGCPVALSSRETEEYGRNFADTNYFLRFPKDNVPRLRLRYECYTPPGNYFELDSDGSLCSLNNYGTMNLVSSVAWSLVWLPGFTKAHSLEDTYIPALKKAVR